MLRLIFPLLMGVLGAGVLIGLGVWQLQRLELKTEILAQIDAKIGAAPVSLPDVVTLEADKYLPVTVTGRLLGPEALVLTGLNAAGAGFRFIGAFELNGSHRKIMVDLGFVTEDDRGFTLQTAPFTVTGNLHWPAEKDSFTPEPDLIRKFWFARDVTRMANVLGTEQVLVVASAIEPPIPALSPLPVDSKSVPNDHLNYAITWFSLAVVWLGMTALWLWRIRRRTV